jgi:hypothetical protein
MRCELCSTWNVFVIIYKLIDASNLCVVLFG